MNEEKSNKQAAPPPLLLMGASQGLTLDPPDNSNLLLTVPQTDASLFPTDDGAEEDSFIGQTEASSAPFTYFQQTSHSSDPFASVGQPPAVPVAQTFASNQPPSQPSSTAQSSPLFNTHSIGPGSVPAQPPPPVAAVAPLQGTTVGSPMPPQFGSPAGMPPPSGTAVNFHRQKGPLKYAPPPTGTFSTPGSTFPQAPAPFLPGGVSTQQNMVQPPTSISFDHQYSHQQPAVNNPMLETSGVSVLSEDRSKMLPPSSSSQTSINLTPPADSTAGLYITYIPVQYHWFYVKRVELRLQWFPFSIIDSNNLEQAYRSGEYGNSVVCTDGGRYDVDVMKRIRNPVYWEENPSEVRRCAWFYRPEGENRFVPYDEGFAEKLEEEYKVAITTNVWHKKLEFNDGETIVMHNPNVIVNFTAASQPDQWGNSTVSTDSWNESYRPRVVKRGVEQAFDDLIEGEPQQVDHIVFVVHGIGSTCDLRFRNIVECVDDFRKMSMQILHTHFKHHQEEGRIGRVEYLPVRWHNALHGDATGIDRKLKAITLNSIGKLRHFTNDTLLDILFYSSPAYAQQIADTVGSEINRLYSLFSTRNPNFKGGCSVSGHSLGSLILFDLLVHQKEQDHEDKSDVSSQIIDTSVISEQNNSALNLSLNTSTGDSAQLNGSMSREENAEEEVKSIEELLAKLGLSSFHSLFEKEHIDMETLTMCSDSDIKEMGLPLGPRKKLQNFISSQKEKEKREREELAAKLKREAEIQAAEEVRQQQQKQADQELAQEINSHSLLPSASGTSVNYVVGVAGTGIPLVKYPQLNFQPNHFFALGSPIAMFLTVRGVEFLGEDFTFPTCHSFFNIFHPFDPVAYRLEPMIVNAYPPKPVLMPHHMGRKRLHLELKESIARMGSDIKQKIIQSMRATWKTINDFAAAHRSTPEVVEQEMDDVLHQIANQNDETESIASSMPEDDLLVGNINQGRRIDYVLQEKPIESFNDYLFALGSHGCYWESEDTVLMLLKEIYSIYGFVPARPGKSPVKSGYPHHYNQHSHQPIGPPPSVNSAMGQPPQSYSGSAGRPPMMPGASSTGVAMSEGSGIYGMSQKQPEQSISFNSMTSSPQTQQELSSSNNFTPPPLSGFVPRK